MHRTTSESIAPAKAHEEETGETATLDAEFAADVEEIIATANRGIRPRGLILDSSAMITGERQGHTVRQIGSSKTGYGETKTGLSVATTIELTHGIAGAGWRTRCAS